MTVGSVCSGCGRTAEVGADGAAASGAADGAGKLTADDTCCTRLGAAAATAGADLAVMEHHLGRVNPNTLRAH